MLDGALAEARFCLGTLPQELAALRRMSRLLRAERFEHARGGEPRIASLLDDLFSFYLERMEPRVVKTTTGQRARQRRLSPPTDPELAAAFGQARGKFVRRMWPAIHAIIACVLFSWDLEADGFLEPGVRTLALGTPEIFWRELIDRTIGAILVFSDPTIAAPLPTAEGRQTASARALPDGHPARRRAAAVERLDKSLRPLLLGFSQLPDPRGPLEAEHFASAAAVLGRRDEASGAPHAALGFFPTLGDGAALHYWVKSVRSRAAEEAHGRRRLVRDADQDGGVEVPRSTIRGWKHRGLVVGVPTDDEVREIARRAKRNMQHRPEGGRMTVGQFVTAAGYHKTAVLRAIRALEPVLGPAPREGKSYTLDVRWLRALQERLAASAQKKRR